MVGTLDNPNNVLTTNLGKYEKKFTYINFIQYNLDRDIVDNINQILFRMNREEHLIKTFPLEDGTTYIQNLDNVMCEYSGLPSVQSYEPKGVGVGGESLKENFIDSI
jgi:hypothetical protein